MDKIESLSNTISNITLYDLKSMYNQAKNVVLNVSEMEGKVREATNEDPWGASSTLMQDIAQGTFHFQYFNEIMPAIYSRFMEKEARQWRQIYKALQLLEYLIKHGSERVVDDARSHISTLKMLRNFHYIDDKGKDEGINVRNRSKELIELLSDVEKIRSERKKAKANKNKYIGVGSDGMGFGGGGGFETSGGGRYGGFGSESSSSYNTNDHYSSGGGGGGSSSRGGGSSFSDNARNQQFEAYDAGDDEIPHSATRTSTSTRRSTPSAATPTRKATAPPPPAPAPIKEVDLLGGFDEDSFAAPPSAGLATNKALPAVAAPLSLDDDDFDDFQAAPIQQQLSGPASVAPAPTTKKPNLMDMLGATPVQPATGFGQPQQLQQQNLGGFGMGGGMGMGMGGHRPTSSLSTGSSQFSSPMTAQPAQNMFGGGAPLRPTMGNSSLSSSAGGFKPATGTAPAAAKAGSVNFDDLWNMSLGTSGQAKPAAGPSAGKSIKDLEKEKASAGLWGGQHQKQGSMGMGMGFGGAPQKPNNAFGSFGNAPPPSTGGGDDLLL
ncbi:hypothetical protein CPB83DRAFT_846209 [Crepidotus variabilis]|uniref:ENTH domain-containing protein n=1 Tax=Crepidotus variabilis TaxID=179855 RepID=A0A9P6EQ23_9AGAR|nr:hypothetical protein CPB83DRAFT_846209 [Crepidotus variabilis]